MNAHPDPIGEFDLAAYVDGQLPFQRRSLIEGHLASHPQEAASVMADLRLNTELRLALGATAGMERPRTSDAARRLQGARSRRRLAPVFRRFAAIGLLLAVGWVAHSQFGPLGVRESVASARPPAFVEDAMRAHRTSLIRAGMASQPETKRYDPAEILSATAISMPTLPGDWTVTDVQIFPSTYGPSVELALRAPGNESLSLYAVRPGAFDVTEARLTPSPGDVAAYWQIGEVAYALVAPELDRAQLGQWAGTLARTLY
ncbi:anti-sigma factor [Aureimonas sp. ME7]|uniref:anti-sigma factor family protein n=1 Tax=Aureimonas sp. ME7 TaxID=2744252 RepID=UPI0015F6581B|nr:anti-sigma factor [Aureimonas sp. ME7]